MLRRERNMNERTHFLEAVQQVYRSLHNRIRSLSVL